MDDAPVNLKKLAEEAAREAYSPRAEKCWPWSHQWTMWAKEAHPVYSSQEIRRRHCLRCGKIKTITKNLTRL